MPPILDAHHRSSTLERDLEVARRKLSDVEREEAEQEARQKREYERWIQRKAEKVRGAFDLFLRVYKLIRKLDDEWRRDVFRGEEKFSEETDRAIRGLYGLWIAYSGGFQEKAAYLGRHRIDLSDLQSQVDKCRRESEQLLWTWEPPALSTAPSFRPAPLSEEATARLREMFPGAI